MRDQHAFLWQSLEILNNFNTFERHKLFKKLEYRFLVESTKIDSISALSEANVKTNKWRVQNWPITKNRVLPVTTFFFQKFCFSLGTSYVELIWCTNHPNVHNNTFRRCSLWVSLKSIWMQMKQGMFKAMYAPKVKMNEIKHIQC